MSYTPPINPTYTSAIGVNSDTAISGGNWTSNTYVGAGEQNDYSYVAILRLNFLKMVLIGQNTQRLISLLQVV
jgi:hypothetical protein